MPSNLEIRTNQKSMLFDLLKLKKDNTKEGILVVGLDVLIIKLQTAMEEEDVALVEKNIASLDLLGK